VDLSSIRFVITGGAPVPERLVRTYLDRGITLLQGYGLSEAAPLALLLDAASALDRIGSAGRPPLLVDVRIDVDGRDASPNETGELLVRGPNVMAGYWRKPEETRQVLTAGGWLRTGDAARADQDGYIWIVGRVEDRIVTDAGMVHPGDVERVLLLHPSVADVGVVGLQSEHAGESVVVLVAVVVLASGASAGEEELLAFARERLPAPSVPASIRYADEVPRNSVGKLRRQELRARLTDERLG